MHTTGIGVMVSARVESSSHGIGIGVSPVIIHYVLMLPLQMFSLGK